MRIKSVVLGLCCAASLGIPVAATADSSLGWLWPFEWMPDSAAPSDATKVQILGNAYAQLQNLQGGSGALGLGIGVESNLGNGLLVINKGSIDGIDNDRSKFGKFLLAPGASSVGALALLQYYPLKPNGWLHRLTDRSSFGLRVSLEAGQTDWSMPDPSTPGSKIVRSSLGLGLTAGPSFKWAFSSTKNNLVIRLHPIQYAHRTLAGDAASDVTFRTAALGTAHRHFSGFEIGGEIQINKIFATIALPYIGGTRPDQLTGGQLLLSLGVKDGIDL